MEDTIMRASLRDTPERWMRQTTYLMGEMFHALEQAKMYASVGGNPDLTKEERRTSWMDRAAHLEAKALLCVENAYNDNIPLPQEEEKE